MAQLKPQTAMTAVAFIAPVKGGLGSVKAPKFVDFMERLPRSTVGTVLQTELRKRPWHGQ